MRTTAQLRAWQRRAASLERRAAALLSDMISAVGLDFEMAGENLTGQADDVMATAQNLVDYLETCVRVTRDPRGAHPRALAQPKDQP